MISHYHVVVISQHWYLYIYLVLVTLVDWYVSRSIYKSVHGILLITASIYAVYISESTSVFYSPDYLYWPLHALCFLGLLSAIYALSKFQDKFWLHILHAGTMLSSVFIWFGGIMIISHDWI